MLKFNKVFMYITASALSVSLWTCTSFAQQNKTGVTTASMLNVRENPSTSTKVIGQIPNGSKVDIIETSNGWYKVSYNGKTGWVYSSYVKVTETPKPAVVDETIVATLNKGSSLTDNNSSNNSSTNNSTANNSSNDNSTTNKSSSNQVIDETIQKPNQKPASAEKAENTVVKTGIVKASVLNVRQGAGTSYSVVDKLPNGAKVNIVNEQSGWYQIKLANGSTGWVSSTYVNVNTTIASRGGIAEDSAQASPKNSDVSDVRGQIVEYAKKFLGVKYVYGGNSPSQGFDCSGYVKYVFSNFGINLERVAASQAKQYMGFKGSIAARRPCIF
ncbi:C40 family peptidase [Acetivibrio straminisolvens]|uniref:Hypothetical lipoprotein LppH n=1 Tax=Acetivibrio straminisolvens JCM 21531 TaxID=1294263 RepID=W4V0Z5_9FIRM|nr:SH3 domain-containing protein [Acetivibrio straminisolvens]GAE86891.1 hypothetical lipoprotein LppH [Acetivibrio straminisolvens JCM 21531]